MSKVLVAILAAGGATRFGGAKQSALVAGVPLIARAVDTASVAGADKVRIIVGAHAAETLRALPLPAAPGAPPVEVVENPNWESGQASSVSIALEGMEEGYDAILIMPVDQPFLDGALLRKMIEEWRKGARLVAPLVDGEVRGAPALFAREYFGELRALSGDMGGRAVLRHHAGQVATVAAEASQLLDIDTQDDLDAAETDARNRRNL